MNGPPGPRPLIEMQDVVVDFPARQTVLGRSAVPVRAVNGVSLHLKRGEVLGLVGESGSGKTTLARLALGLLAPTRGRVLWRGQPLAHLQREGWSDFHTRVQIVFQDPTNSLNPRMSAGRTIEEVLLVHGLRGDAVGRRARAEELLELVGLSARHFRRYPHELSGGEGQRVVIARALAVEPELLVLDEPVSAVDVSVQAQVINLLADLQETLGLTYLLIAHDLALVRTVCHRVAVMYAGRIVETASSGDLFRRPMHPYTQVLLAAVPTLEGGVGRNPIPESVVNAEAAATASGTGCPFYPRCPHPGRNGECAGGVPLLEAKARSHFAACVKVRKGPGDGG